jgi:hypothetical protein
MAKKQNTLITALIIAGVVGGGLYWYNRRKQSGEDTAAELPGSAEPGTEETATVTAKSKNDIYDAIEKAQEIAANTKDAVVTVKDAAENVIAEVTSGEASDPSKKEARRLEREKRKAERKARRAARKAARRKRRAERRAKRRRR